MFIIANCRNRNAYIATQAPLPSTTNDFWQMVWSHECCIVVVLSRLYEGRGAERLHEYWPNGRGEDYGGLIVDCGRLPYSNTFHRAKIPIAFSLRIRYDELHAEGVQDNRQRSELISLVGIVSDIPWLISERKLADTAPIPLCGLAGEGRSPTNSRQLRRVRPSGPPDQVAVRLPGTNLHPLHKRSWENGCLCRGVDHNREDKAGEGG